MTRHHHIPALRPAIDAVAAPPAACQNGPPMSRVFPLVRRFVDNPRVRVPTLVFSGVLLISLLERLAVFVGHGDRLEGVSGGDIVRSFAVGLRFDLVAAALLA